MVRPTPTMPIAMHAQVVWSTSAGPNHPTAGLLSPAWVAHAQVQSCSTGQVTLGPARGLVRTGFCIGQALLRYCPWHPFVRAYLHVQRQCCASGCGQGQERQGQACAGHRGMGTGRNEGDVVSLVGI